MFVGRGVDVPAVEARKAGFIVIGRGGVLSEVVLKGCVSTAVSRLVVVEGNARNRLEVWMQDELLVDWVSLLSCTV